LTATFVKIEPLSEEEILIVASRCYRNQGGSGLAKIAASCGKRRQKSGAVERPVGRLLERNTGAAPRLFDVQVEVDAQGFTQLRWTKMASWREWRVGVKGAASCAAM